LTLDRDEFEFAINASGHQYRGMRLSMLAEDTEMPLDAAGEILERMYLIKKAVDAMGKLFGSFMNLRLSAFWEAEVSRMSEWATK
jgi:hypothetical protein